MPRRKDGRSGVRFTLYLTPERMDRLSLLMPGMPYPDAIGSLIDRPLQRSVTLCPRCERVGMACCRTCRELIGR
jgi:hypothetical protein